MTPAEKHQLDQTQFQLNELKQRVDVLVTQMHDFRDEAMRLLKAMGGSVVEPVSESDTPSPEISVMESATLPEIAPVLHPAPEPIAAVPQSFEIPDISVGWSGGQRRN